MQAGTAIRWLNTGLIVSALTRRRSGVQIPAGSLIDY